MRTVASAVALALCLACGSPSRPHSAPPLPLPPPPPIETADFSPSFGVSTPEEQGIDSAKLLRLTKAVREQAEAPLFSLLVSRHGKLVYELYTSSLGREEAHYLMSVTKSVVSTLVGIAIDQHLLSGPDQPITEALPRDVFPTDADRERFRGITIKHVLGMSALDAPVAPHQKTPEARERLRGFMASPNRVRFALGQSLLASPGTDFLYTDITPAIAVGLVEYGARMSALDFAETYLFGPLGFRNAEWMHEDRAGIDNGGFGLRLRPIDMQKLGVLFLRHGDWNGRQILSRQSVDLAFSPWIARKPDAREPIYGWYWWTHRYGPGWTAHLARGWKGQVIAVFPEQDLVVTMTGAFEDGSEDHTFDSIVQGALKPSIEPGSGDARPPNPKTNAELSTAIDEVRRGPTRISATIEKRMIPSVARKEAHRPFTSPFTSP